MAAQTLCAACLSVVPPLFNLWAGSRSRELHAAVSDTALALAVWPGVHRHSVQQCLYHHPSEYPQYKQSSRVVQRWWC